MKFEYSYSRNDLKNYLNSKNNNLIIWSSIADIVIVSIIILLSLKKLLIGDLVLIIFVALGSAFLLCAMLIFALKLFNKVLMLIYEKTIPFMYGDYSCKIDKKKIVTKNKYMKIEIKKEEIEFIISDEDKIQVCDGKKTILLEKIILGEELYFKVKEALSKLK